MLTIYGQTSSAAVKSYFSAADYYSEGQETVGRWGGKLAPLLGLRGEVQKCEFDRMCDNLHPQTGERLTQRTNDKRRIGYDFVLSGPKSFSIALALAPDDLRPLLQRAFDDAALETMEKHVEPDMLTRVRKDGAFDNRRTGNMCWAWFGHSTSRPVPGFVADPQEHAHFFVFNVTDDPEEERLKAGEFGGIKRDGEYYSAVFYSLLAKRLADLGLGIDKRGGKEWELEGILQSMIDKFSKRRDQVLDKAEELGITQKWRISELTPTTRAKKDKTLTRDDLRGEWDSQLTDAERDALAAVYERQAEGGPAVTASEAVAYAIAHLSDKLSVFDEREVKRVALFYGLGSLTPDQVAAELPRAGVITADIDGRLMATTRGLQAEESYLVGRAMAGRGKVAPVGVAEGLSRQLASGKRLNDGQWAVVTGLLGSTDKVSLVEGPAGAGKSSMLGKLDEGLRRAGRDVHYFATTAAAVGVLQKDGFTAAETVAHLLMNEKRQEAIKGSRVVIDETSMLGHKDAVRLFKLADTLDLKLIFVGDPMQHGAVARGALMRILKQYGGITPFRLTEIIRQENPAYREAAELLAAGRTVEGFDAIDAMGRISEIGDDVDRNRHIAADYLQALDDRKSVLVVSPTWAEAKAITAAIRQELREAKCIEGEDREFTRLVPVDASEAQRGQAFAYRPGDVIQFHQNAKGGFTKGDRLVVTDPAKVPLGLAEHFSLYRPEKIALAQGDVIRFTGTVKTLDGKHTLRNGMAKTIAEITPGGNLRLDNGWVVGKDAGHFRHGYVETSFGSQGRTVDRVILGMSSRSTPAMNMEQLYVSASRAKQWIRLYTDNKEEIRDAVKRSSQKLAALDVRPKLPEARPDADASAWQRRQKHLARRRRLSFFHRIRAAWEKKPEKQLERQAGHGYSR